MKDELIRQTIMDTQDDVDEIKDKLDKIDERLFDLQKNRQETHEKVIYIYFDFTLRI